MYPIRTAGLLAACSLVACSLATLFVTGTARAAAASEGDAVYQFSPVNQHNVQITASYWNPIMDYVSQASGVTLRLKLGRTSADTTSFVLAQEVDFAFTNHLFAPERARMGWRVLARRTGAAVRSQIVSLASSPVRQLKDLAGADIAFPGPEATVAYRSATRSCGGRRFPSTWYSAATWMAPSPSWSAARRAPSVPTRSSPNRSSTATARRCACCGNRPRSTTWR